MAPAARRCRHRRRVADRHRPQPRMDLIQAWRGPPGRRHLPVPHAVHRPEFRRTSRARGAQLTTATSGCVEPPAGGHRGRRRRWRRRDAAGCAPGSAAGPSREQRHLPSSTASGTRPIGRGGTCAANHPGRQCRRPQASVCPSSLAASLPPPTETRLGRGETSSCRSQRGDGYSGACAGCFSRSRPSEQSLHTATRNRGRADAASCERPVVLQRFATKRTNRESSVAPQVHERRGRRNGGKGATGGR